MFSQKAIVHHLTRASAGSRHTRALTCLPDTKVALFFQSHVCQATKKQTTTKIYVKTFGYIIFIYLLCCRFFITKTVMTTNISMNPNLLVQYLQKDKNDFTREDIIRYCKENGIRFINFHYCGWEGRVKTLNFVINSEEYLRSRRESGRFKPVPIHSGRQERPLRHSALPHRICQSADRRAYTRPLLHIHGPRR